MKIPELRHPMVEDGPAIWRLVRDSQVLDLNSSYAYLAHCRHFPGTSVVAEMDDRVVGFVSGYVLPDRPDTYFLWQVGVDPVARGQGLATKMIQWVLGADAAAKVSHLETTITPDNEPSRRLFRGLARRLAAECEVSACFEAELLGDGHEPEELFRIGPFSRSTR